MRRSPIIPPSSPLLALTAVFGLAACGALAHTDRTGPRLTCTDDPSQPPTEWIDPTKGKSAAAVFPDPKAAALAKAVAQSDTARMRALLQDGADPNARGMRAITLLSWALRRESRSGIDLERADIVGDTPLFVANGYNDFRRVLFLLKAGANPLAHDTHGHTFQLFLNMTPVAVRSKEAKAEIAEIDAWLTAHHAPLEPTK